MAIQMDMLSIKPGPGFVRSLDSYVIQVFVGDDGNIADMRVLGQITSMSVSNGSVDGSLIRVTIETILDPSKTYSFNPAPDGKQTPPLKPEQSNFLEEINRIVSLVAETDT